MANFRVVSYGSGELAIKNGSRVVCYLDPVKLKLLSFEETEERIRYELLASGIAPTDDLVVGLARSAKELRSSGVT